MQHTAESRNGTKAKALINHDFVRPRPSRKVWDIALAIATEEPRASIAARFEVSRPYITQVAIDFGLSSRAPRSSFIRRDSGGAFLIIGAASFAIDEAVTDEVSTYNWHVNGGYAANSQLGPLHRWLMRAAFGEEVDHIDGDQTNNRRANLRIVSRSENMRNRQRFGSAPTIFKGVSKSGDKWRATIQVDGKRKALGRFANPVNAAHAYDCAARKHFGKFARLNFPEKGEQSALLVHDEAALRELLAAQGPAS